MLKIIALILVLFSTVVATELSGDPLAEDSIEPDSVYDPAGEYRFAVFAEGALSVGGLGHTFNDDAIEQFGYDVDTGCEQDGAYLILGGGRYFGRFSTFIFGEIGRIAPGVLFDNHGPWIPPEVLLRMTMLAGGVELRYAPVRVRFGYGAYPGTAEIDNDYSDSLQAFPPGSWETGIEDATGWHYSVGYHQPIDENMSAGIEWVQHFIDLRLEENGTEAVPTEQSAVQSEVRFVFTYQLPL